MLVFVLEICQPLLMSSAIARTLVHWGNMRWGPMDPKPAKLGGTLLTLILRGRCFNRMIACSLPQALYLFNIEAMIWNTGYFDGILTIYQLFFKET